MNRKFSVIVFLSAAALVSGCNKEQTASEQIAEVKTETKATTMELKDYTFDHKAEFVAHMQAQVDALNKNLEELSAKIEKSTDAIKLEAKPKLQALRDQVSQLNKQLDEVRNGTQSTWDSVKATTAKAFDSAKDGFQQSRQWLSDKIAP
jgi:chromosome segregation ATPase